MKNKKEKRYMYNSISNAASGIINRVITLLIPFFMRTLLIYTLGEQYLGFSSLFASILQVLNLADLGFASAISYSLYKPIAEEDDEKICALLNLYRSIYWLIGLIIMIVGLFLLPFLDVFIKGSYPTDVNLQLVYLVYLTNTVISYVVFSHKRTLLSAHQESYIDRTINSVLHVFFDILRVVLLIIKPNYYFYIIWYPISALIENCIIAYIAKKMYPNYVCRGKVDKETLLEIRKRVIGICFQKFGNTISTSLDSIIISSYIGLTALAIYSNYFYIISSIMAFIWVAISSVVASLGNSMVTTTVEQNYEHYKRLSLINNWAIIFCIPSLICLYQHFMQMWVGESLMESMNLVICLVSYFFIAQSRKVGMVFREASGLWWADRWRPIIAAGVNLIVNITLVQVIGINGVIISTIISYTLVELPWETYILFKEYFKRSAYPHYVQLLKCLIVASSATALSWFVCSNILLVGVGGFVLKGCVCVLISNVLFILIYGRTKEFNYFISKVKYRKSKEE